jgi:colanic acid/amylovoran biosynthesis glycosyltransferase
MRVAHICKHFSKTSETFIYNLITGLQKQGIENHVLTNRRVNARERPFEAVTVISDPVHLTAAYLFKRQVLRILDYRISGSAYTRILRQLKPDIVVAHLGWTGRAVHHVVKDLDIPMITVFHAADIFSWSAPPGCYEELWKTVSAAVAISTYGQEYLETVHRCPVEKLHMIHCGVDISKFQAGPAREPGAEPRMITLGRLIEKKGTADLIRAVALARDRHGARCRLTVCGDGPLGRSLKRLAKAEGLSSVVTFRSGIPSRKVSSLFGEHDLFALASREARNGDREGIPIVIMESQAMGMPVLTTRHSGIPEAIPEPNHRFLAREGDVEDLAEKLVYLLSCRAQWPEIGALGRSWVERRFSRGLEVEEFIRLFSRFS